jgi:hypothetical protein
MGARIGVRVQSARNQLPAKWPPTGLQRHANRAQTAMQLSDEQRYGRHDEYATRRAYASAWRSYRRPDNAEHIGTAGRDALEGMVQGAQRKSREWQREQLRRTGFATAQAEQGHAVTRTLLELGYTPTTAHVAGQLAAVPTAYNFQGNARIAAIVGRSKRTVQRARLRLEQDGLIRSELLLTGDRIDGQRAPVRHPQVIRDVTALQRLARVRTEQLSPGRRKRRRKGPSAAETPAPRAQPVSAETFDRLARDNPELASHFAIMAEAAAKREAARKPAAVPPAVPPAEIDAWDRETARQEQELRRREQLEREREPLPPERGPPR